MLDFIRHSFFAFNSYASLSLCLPSVQHQDFTMIFQVVPAFVQVLALVAPVVLSAPLSDRSSDNTASTTAVLNDTIDNDFVRPAQFSRIAYCSSAAVEAWNCGEPCQALGMNGVTPLVVGGGACFALLLVVLDLC